MSCSSDPSGTGPRTSRPRSIAIASSIANEDIRERLTALGFEPMASTPEEMSHLIKIEAEFWQKVIEAAKLKAM
jgi:tripartite-type tricarboxylate transporter receptor subunit TctC